MGWLRQLWDKALRVRGALRNAVQSVAPTTCPLGHILSVWVSEFIGAFLPPV